MNAASSRRDSPPSVAARLLLATIAWYKLLISPYFRGSCRFLPSCADYAAMAVARHGAIIGGWLALRRLARCHPLCVAGYDPVPESSRPPASSRPGWARP